MRSESSRLYANSQLLHLQPEELCQRLSLQMKPYAAKTTLIRIADYKAFTGDVTLRNFLRNNRKRFQNAYEKERLNVNYNGALRALEQIKDTRIRNLCYELLFSGARISELLSHKHGQVVGKGGRIRTLFLRDSLRHYAGCSYSEVYKSLKAVGLKPHTLRKLAATRMAEMGFREADLMRVMGWSQISTAACYLQPKRDEEIRRRLLEA